MRPKRVTWSAAPGSRGRARGRRDVQALVPTDYGGAGTTLAGGLDAMRALGKADSATGWCVMIANTTLLAARLDATVAHQIFGPMGPFAGAAAPVGTATLHESNVTISGRWAWGSGSSRDDHGGQCANRRPGGSAGATARRRASGIAFVPEGVELLDTWQVSGLQGTASTDYVIDDAVVPVDHVVAMDQRRLVVDETLYRFSTFGALALGVAMVMIGMAERAIEELTALAGEVPRSSAASLSVPRFNSILPGPRQNRSARAFVDQQVGTAWGKLVGAGGWTMSNGWRSVGRQPCRNGRRFRSGSVLRGRWGSGVPEFAAATSFGMFTSRHSTPWSPRVRAARAAPLRPADRSASL